MKKIIFFEKENGEKPVLKFLEGLHKKIQAKAYRDLQLLQEYGFDIGEPYLKKVKGDKYKGMYELRTIFGNDISRVLFVTRKKDKIVLLRGFVKKSQKRPKKNSKLL